MQRVLRLLLWCALTGLPSLLVPLPIPAATGAAYTPVVEQGEIGGAKFAIASRKGTWNGQVLLLAHGYRAESAPLVADLVVEHGAYQALLKEGWIVAKTSYRRNGIILADAIADLDALLAYIADQRGTPQRVILEGDSMGGAIVTLIAERSESPYAGAVAVGAALQVREAHGTSGVNLRPKIPLIFLTNQSEWEGPRAYVEKVNAQAAATQDRDIVPPALFRVARDGHVNVNQAERLIALRALLAWLDQGREALPSVPPGAYFNATALPVPEPSRAQLGEDQRSLRTTVTEVSAIYGNVWLDVQPDDLKRIGLVPGAYFQLQAGERTFRVRYGRDFNSVERGHWVLFPNADGYVWLARNQANAAEAAGLKAGDPVEIRRFAATP